MEQHARDVRNALVKRLRYEQVDVMDRMNVAAALAAATSGGAQPAVPVAAYLALPTALIVLTAFGAAGLPAGSRIAVENPFGEDLQEARQLNALLAEALGETRNASSSGSTTLWG